jgi:hypothetical protein
MVFQFHGKQTQTLTRILMEKPSNGMKVIRWQLPLRLLFAGTLHRSQRMMPQRAVIDCRTGLFEHERLHVALSSVKSPPDLCILLPFNWDDFTIRCGNNSGLADSDGYLSGSIVGTFRLYFVISMKSQFEPIGKQSEDQFIPSDRASKGGLKVCQDRIQ